MLLAEGRLEFVAEFGVKEYDVAALVPIITEAGGRFTSFDGADSIAERSSLATNGILHTAFLSTCCTPDPHHRSLLDDSPAVPARSRVSLLAATLLASTACSAPTSAPDSSKAPDAGRDVARADARRVEPTAAPRRR